MPRLISPTFLDSFAYYQSIENEESYERSRQELLDRLRGVKTPPTEAMLRGIQFEQDVCDVMDGKTISAERKLKAEHIGIINSVARMLHGASRQVHVGHWLDSETLIHGYVDFLLPGLIVDTKTTGRAYEWGKYLDNCQHLTYLVSLSPFGYMRFKYIVVTFNQYGAVDMTQEDYYYRPQMVDTLKSRCAEFFDYLTIDPEMSEAYYARDHSVPNDLLIKGAA